MINEYLNLIDVPIMQHHILIHWLVMVSVLTCNDLMAAEMATASWYYEYH